jgi:hypothetical protein
MYDDKCLDLAEFFLADEGSLTRERADDLAQHIQTAIEDWLSQNPKQPADTASSAKETP